MIEFVEQEITKIKEKQDEERLEVQQKDEAIQSQQAHLDELTRQVEIKNEEIKIL